MQIEQSVTAVLDEAIQALTVLDLDKLQHLEEQVTVLANSGSVGLNGLTETILSKKRLLAMLLQNCRSNLDALNRLHSRNTGDQWAH